jgi:hypothetical protein
MARSRAPRTTVARRLAGSALRRCRVLVALVALHVVTHPTVAGAQAEAEEEAEAAGETGRAATVPEPAVPEPAVPEPAISERAISERAASAPVTPDERRDPAHYRGRARPTPPEEALAWIPRILFAPFALVTEIVLRRPVVAFLEWAERHDLFQGIDYLLNPDPNVSWSPTLSFEANVLALPGVQAEWRNALVEGHDVRVEFAMGATDFWRAWVRDRWRFGPVFFGARGGHHTRPERPFYGLGPDSASQRTYYAETQTELSGFVGVEHGHHVRAELSAGYSLEETGRGIEPSATTQFDPSDIPGFGLYELGLVSFDLTLDSRRDVDEPGGLRFVGNTTFGLDARDTSRSFMTVELQLEAAVEVSAPDRVLGVRAYAMNTAPFGDAPVPFMHLAWLGWDRHRGFVRGRFRGEAAVFAEVRYRYPINFYVDALWLASAGNVFSRDGSDFDVGALTGSFGVGFRTRRTGFAPIEMTFALGTSQFDSGLSIESARFFFETMYGL